MTVVVKAPRGHHWKLTGLTLGFLNYDGPPTMTETYETRPWPEWTERNGLRVSTDYVARKGKRR